MNVRKAVSVSISAILLVGALQSATIEEAHAYIDLGSGSFLIQIFLATFFAALFAIKVFWQRLSAQISVFCHWVYVKVRKSDTSVLD